jgi:hypothetical protein
MNPSSSAVTWVGAHHEEVYLMAITIVSAPPLLGLTYLANKFSDLLRPPRRPSLWGFQ